jgi:dCMP deaminase
MTAERITRDEMLMSMAKISALRGTCSRASVGVVIARDGRILSTGYNGAPSGVTHCDHTCDCRSLDYTGGHLHAPVCNSEQPCLVAVHAEANAISWAARGGISLLDSTMYVTMSPCRSCAQLIINSGVNRIIIDQWYRDPAGVTLLASVGMEIEAFKDL